MKTTRPSAHPYQIDKAYFIRTVTRYYIGKLVAVYPQELVFEQAVWVADTGRFHQAVPIGQVLIGRGSIVDASIWTSPDWVKENKHVDEHPQLKGGMT